MFLCVLLGVSAHDVDENPLLLHRGTGLLPDDPPPSVRDARYGTHEKMLDARCAGLLQKQGARRVQISDGLRAAPYPNRRDREGVLNAHREDGLCRRRLCQNRLEGDLFRRLKSGLCRRHVMCFCRS